VLRRLLLVAVLVLASCSGRTRRDVSPELTADFAGAAAREAALRDPAAGPALSESEQVEHVLARTSFGARPGDRERVARLGVAAFLEQQLHPEELEDARVESQLKDYAVLRRGAGALAHELTGKRKAKQEADRQKAAVEASADAATRAVTGPMTAAQAAQQAAERASLPPEGTPSPLADGPPQPAPAVKSAALTPSATATATAPTPAAKATAAGPQRRGGKELRKALGRAGRGPGFDYVADLSEAKLVRAVSSERQLQEVMVDFWFNHFNVFAGKENEAALLPDYEEKAIRPNALGSFADLLSATAHSPAMLVYLDNRLSSAAAPPKQPRRYAAWYRGRKPDPAQKGKGKPPGRRGLNENYGRELLELHTLGVDGGYTQQDIIEVARCFTGWTVDQPNEDPRFVYRAALHDDGEKHVLGQVIPAGGGERDGSRVLEILLHHPSTARFIARKLARRFVSDDPPDTLVARIAATFTRTHGDIRSMLRTLFESPEFWSRRALKAKVRSPLELVAGSVRALGGTIDDPLVLARAVARIGEPLYGAQPPTGYADTAQGWVSSGALLARIDFGLQLANGQLDGVQVDLKPIAAGLPSPEGVLQRAAAQLGASELSTETRSYVLGQLQDSPRRPDLLAARAVGLLLGAPELQRR
jgi:uncharacterized protein (DUF1800 family)